MALIELAGIKKTYGKAENKVYALRGIDLQVEQGEMVAITGTSGSGKSTLLNILGGLTAMTDGNYVLEGKAVDLKNRRKLIDLRRNKIGYVVQHFALIPELTAFKNVELPLKYQKVKRKERKVRVENMLHTVGLQEKMKNYPDELSGGQQQRVAIARALVKNPDLILADEPTGALDSKTSEDIMQVFHTLNQEGHTVVIVTHDGKVASQCNRIVKIEDGRIV